MIGCIFGEKSDEIKYIFPALVFVSLTVQFYVTSPGKHELLYTVGSKSNLSFVSVMPRVTGHRAHLAGFIRVVGPAGGGDDGVDFGPTALRALPAEVT